jgi:hypothetical protein
MNLLVWYLLHMIEATGFFRRYVTRYAAR